MRRSGICASDAFSDPRRSAIPTITKEIPMRTYGRDRERRAQQLHDAGQEWQLYGWLATAQLAGGCQRHQELRCTPFRMSSCSQTMVELLVQQLELHPSNTSRHQHLARNVCRSACHGRDHRAVDQTKITKSRRTADRASSIRPALQPGGRRVRHSASPERTASACSAASAHDRIVVCLLRCHRR